MPGLVATAKAVGKLAANRKPCSCNMCGNPRRHFGDETRQEKIVVLPMREQIREIDLSPT